MTNEWAILLLEAYKSNLTSSCSNQLDGDIEAFDMAIKSLRNERPKGEWKVNNYGEHVCPICGHYALYDECQDNDYYEVQSNFCPECGAEMQKGEEK